MGLEKYESRQQRILRPAEEIYAAVSRFDNFTPILQDRVEEWRADEDACSFRVKGFAVSLRIVERNPPLLVKVTGDEAAPVEFTFWLQLHPAGACDTRMRLVLHVELNTMMKMMLGGKLQQALDSIAERIAEGFNSGTVR